MSCNRKICSFVAARETRSRSGLCLLVLLPYLLLPLIYYNHLAGNAGSPFSHIEGPHGLGSILWGKAAKAVPPNHDQSCPLCRAASSLEDCGFTSMVPASDHPSLLRHYLFSHHPAEIANLYLQVSGPRAPPVVL
jgi:hypothetical protein